MKKLLLILTFIQVSIYSFGQSQEQKDSLINEMCKTLMELEYMDDSTRHLQTITMHLYPFLGKFPEDSRQQLGTSIYFRFQHNCRAFKELLDRMYPIHEDWQNLSERPNSEISSKDCKTFRKYEDFWYFETTGDTVLVEIKGGFWTDSFKDGTYSKLNFFWIDKCQFEIEFIESNNRIRKNYSKPGDRYKYQLLKTNDGYYDVLVENPDNETYSKFKMYVRE
jgi:hypothetical protein